MKPIRHTLAALLILLLTHSGIRAAEDGLSMVVHEGRGAVNVLASNRAASPVVGVTDKSGKPAKGARVTFVLPPAFARAVFADGRESMSVATGEDGRAAAAGMRPINLGSFEIVIRAEYRGLTAATTITQTNVATASHVPPAGSGLAAGQETASFRILVLEGDDGVNIIDKKTAVRPVVRIVDKNNLPVSGVPVAFVILAKRGARAGFPGGRTTMTVPTDANGRAESAALRPEGKGSFQIQIQASVQGQTLTRSIGQTNFPSVAAAQKAGKAPGSSAPAEEVSSASTESAGSSGTSTSASTSSASTTTSTTGAASGGSSGAAGATGAATTATTAGAAAGGLTAGQIGLIAASGAAAAGGIAKAAGVLDDNKPDCTSLVNTALSSMNTSLNCVTTARDPLTQCRTLVQSQLDTAGQLCSCAGGLGGLPADLRSLWNDILPLYRQLGFDTSRASACR